MRLFGYYAWHSFINQLRKLFKTWVIIFILVCGLMGGLIGYSAAVLTDTAEEMSTEEEEVVEDLPDYEDSTEEDGMVIDFGDDGLVITAEDGSITTIPFGDLMEAAGVIIILAVLYFGMFAADKNGGAIFQMADVNLLFSAPIKPQSVLLFRLLCSLGAALAGSLYIMFQIPNLVINAGLGIWAGAALIIVWFGTLAISKLLQVWLYTYCSTHNELKKHLTPALWASILALVGALFVYCNVSGKGYLQGSVSFLNFPGSRFVPFVGWLKGLLMYTAEENAPMALVMAVLLLAGGVLLVWFIWNMKADFYEDAMAKSEETAAMQSDIQEGRSIVAKKKNKKDKSEKITRDGMHYGSGANVFFFKSLYNRFRFARFGILTKTNITYLFLMAGVLAIQYLITEQWSFTMLALAIGVFVFYRSLGNPLEQDTSMAFFVMIPANMWAKLFWSLFAGTVNCLLDILPAMIIGAVITAANPLAVLGWIFLILTVDAYATIVGTFISLSVPESIGKVVKSLIQVLFVYFGLLPDIALIAIGLVLGKLPLMCLASGCVNVILALIFFLLTPLFLEPKLGKRPPVAPVSEEVRLEAKKSFSRLGLAAAIILVVASVLQILLMSVADADLVAENQLLFWLITFAPIYLIAFPLGVWIMRKVPAKRPEEGSFKPLQLIGIFAICEFVMYAGNLIGMLVNTLIGSWISSGIENPLMEYASSDNVWLKILFMVILAPCLEEFIFRKQLIDRMQVYGERTAIIASGLMFGLFHGNFSQFFYAAALGIVFGYVYIKSGKLRYTIGLHMIINFMGSVLSLWLLERAGDDLSALEQLLDGAADATKPAGLIAFGLYTVAIIVIAVAGLIILCINWEKIRFAATDQELGKGQVFSTVWLNPGMLLFVLVCGISFVMALFA